jgi:hypothetical protein
MVDGLVHLVSQHFRIEALAVFLRNQQVAQFFVAWQAADMGGEDTVAACNHDACSGEAMQKGALS